MSYSRSKFKGSKVDLTTLPFYVYLIPVVIFMGLPIVFIIGHAFKPMDELFAFPPQFFVRNPSLISFENLMNTAKTALVPLSRYVFNSLVVTVVVVTATVIIATMAAFALSKMNFKAKKLVFEINNAALMFVPAAVAIPRYLMLDRLWITDTYFAHILPLLVMPVGLFLVKQFMDQVPDSLMESAYLDGANSVGVFFKIIIPMVKPAVATCAILAFQLVWNNTETSSLYTSSESIRTLAFYMGTLSANGTVAGQGVAAAASLIMFLPNLILFIILQGNVMNTMAHSGLK